jgi:hypothetical protein
MKRTGRPNVPNTDPAGLDSHGACIALIRQSMEGTLVIP